MKTPVNKIIGLLLTSLMAIAVLVSVGCQPPGMTPEQRAAYEDSLAQARRDSLLEANRAKCEFKLSNGYEYYKQRNWQKAIENYEEVRDLGCGEAMAENLYLYLGNAYREIDNKDSAIAVYQQGANYLPDNIYLHQNLAYMYKVTRQKQKELKQREAIVRLDSSNVEYLMDLADLYFDLNMFDKQIDALQRILKIEPNNSVAQTSLVTAMKKSGRDPIDVLRTRWQNNPNNSSYGVEYGEELFKRGNFEDAREVFKKVTAIDPENLRAWTQLGRCYENLNQPAKAIDAYQGILKVNPGRKDVIADISSLYLKMNDYKKAMEWANKCINTGSKNGMGYATRGAVYENLASNCSGGKPDFNDKLVYQMAYEDYQQAVDMGYGKVTARIKYLENFIPSKGDWFFHSDAGNQIAPDKECYNWLDRTIKRPADAG